MTEILHSGLKNDSISETFPIRHVNNAGVYFPTRYVKIVPLSSVTMDEIYYSKLTKLKGHTGRVSMPLFGTLH